MYLFWKSLIFLSIIHEKASVYSNSYLYGKINGTLGIPWKLNFSIIAKDFKGVIFCSIDDKGNTFHIFVTKESNNEKNISFTFNLESEVFPLKALCGCDPCDGSRIVLGIQFLNANIKIDCNNLQNGSLKLNPLSQIQGYEDNTNIFCPKPIKMKNNKWGIYIIIGNNGPYLTESNITKHPTVTQMKGCLESFFFDDMKVLFSETGSDIYPSCNMICDKEICNGGRCRENVMKDNVCDCSSTVHNGPFCSRDLQVLGHQTPKIYKVKKNIVEFYLKISWKESSLKHFCLLEIMSGGKHWTFSIYGKDLIINNFIILNINNSEINFMNVTISIEYLIVQSMKDVLKMRYLWNENIQINVGFSATEKYCETYKGHYDIFYNSSQLHFIEMDNKSEVCSTLQCFTQMKMKYRIIIMALFGISFVFAVINCVYFSISSYRKRQKRYTSNIYVEQNIELRLNEKRKPKNSSEGNYSCIDPTYAHMKGTRSSKEENKSGDKIANKRETGDISPPLPPRNI